MEETSSQLIASNIFPTVVVKTLLYPGALANNLISDITIPGWDNMLNSYDLTDVKNAPTVADLKCLEVLFDFHRLLNLNISLSFLVVISTLRFLPGSCRELL